jgi:hypothetical protein
MVIWRSWLFGKDAETIDNADSILSQNRLCNSGSLLKMIILSYAHCFRYE